MAKNSFVAEVTFKVIHVMSTKSYPHKEKFTLPKALGYLSNFTGPMRLVLTPSPSFLNFPYTKAQSWHFWIKFFAYFSKWILGCLYEPLHSLPFLELLQIILNYLKVAQIFNQFLSIVTENLRCKGARLYLRNLHWSLNILRLIWSPNYPTLYFEPKSKLLETIEGNF